MLDSAALSVQPHAPIHRRKSLKPGDAEVDYQFYSFVPHTVKVLDEAEFGDAVWIEVQVAR